MQMQNAVWEDTGVYTGLSDLLIQEEKKRSVMVAKHPLAPILRCAYSGAVRGGQERSGLREGVRARLNQSVFTQ